MKSILGKVLPVALLSLVISSGAQAVPFVAVAFTISEGTGGQVIQHTCTSFVPLPSDLCATSSYPFGLPSQEFFSIIYDFGGSNPSAVDRLIGLTKPGSNQVSDLVSILSKAGTPNSIQLDFISDNGLGQFDLTRYSPALGSIGPLDCVVGASIPKIGRAFTDCISETGMLQLVFNNATDTVPGGTVSVRAFVPEPASLALLGLGLAGLGFTRRKRA